MNKLTHFLRPCSTWNMWTTTARGATKGARSATPATAPTSSWQWSRTGTSPSGGSRVNLRGVCCIINECFFLMIGTSYLASTSYLVSILTTPPIRYVKNYSIWNRVISLEVRVKWWWGGGTIKTKKFLSPNFHYLYDANHCQKCRRVPSPPAYVYMYCTKIAGTLGWGGEHLRNVRPFSTRQHRCCCCFPGLSCQFFTRGPWTKDRLAFIAK